LTDSEENCTISILNAVGRDLVLLPLSGSLAPPRKEFMAGLPTVSRTYTLAQLHATGRAAWKHDYIFVERHVYRIVAVPMPNGTNHVHMRLSDLRESSPLLRDGWMQMPS
jgi:hypothetical protein